MRTVRGRFFLTSPLQNGRTPEVFFIRTPNYELEWFNFFKRLISQAHHQDKAPYKISTQYLESFKSYPIVKFAWGHPTYIRHPYDIHTTYIRHQPLANYSPRRNLFRRGQKRAESARKGCFSAGGYQ